MARRLLLDEWDSPVAKKQGKTRSACEFAGMYLLYLFFAWTPFAICRVVATIAADVWRLVDRRHRLLAVNQSMEHLGMGRAEAEALIRDNYRHYALLFVEVAKLRAMPLEEVRRRTDYNGCDRKMADILSRGKGMIVVTGHLGNWEWGSVVLGMLDAVSGAIARPLDNPRADRFVNEIRSRTGVTVWSKFHCMCRALATLKRGEGFVAVADQDGGRKGCMAPFLNRAGSTMATPVDVAIRTGAPLYVGAVMRAGEPGRFVLESGRVHWPRRNADPAEERIRLLTAVNADLSAIIRKYPEQWIWIHKRWKTMAIEPARPAPPRAAGVAAFPTRRGRGAGAYAPLSSRVSGRMSEPCRSLLAAASELPRLVNAGTASGRARR